MFRVYFLNIMLLAVLGTSYAQSNINVHNTGMRIQSGAVVQVAGDYHSTGAATLQNDGTIKVKEDWSQLAASTYSGSGTVEFNGTTDQSLSSITNMQIDTLSVNNQHTLLLGTDLTIAYELDLSNTSSVQLGTNDLSMLAAATAINYMDTAFIKTNNTGAVNRPVSTTTVFYPVGRSAYNPIELLNDGTSDIFSVVVTDALLEDGTSGAVFTESAVGRTWLVDESVTGGSDVTITVHWDASEELTSFDRTDASIVHYESGDWNATLGNTTVVNTGGTSYKQSANSVTSFSPFGVQNVSPLPVELLSFEVENEDAKVYLDWTTVSEFNNKGFYVERMNDGATDFAVIGWVDGAGDSNQELDYSFVDEHSVSGVTYYRIKQVDFDGSFVYSEVREVIGTSLNFGVELFPNPTSTSVNLAYEAPTPGVTKVVILNEKGAEVLVFDVYLSSKGIIELSEVLTLPSGIYYLNAISGEDSDTKQFTIVR